MRSVWYILIFLLITYIVIVTSGYGHFVGCHSSTLFEEKTITNPTYSPDATHIAFVLLRTKYRTPQGICTFPDGGKNKIVNQSVEIYTVHFKELVPKKVIEKKVRANISLSPSPVETVLWNEQGIYFELLETNQTNGEVNSLHYAVNPFDEKPQITRVQRGVSQSDRARLHPLDETEWIQYEKGVGVNSVFGGDYVKFKDDPFLGTVYHPELDEQQIKKTWLTENQINKL